MHLKTKLTKFPRKKSWKRRMIKLNPEERSRSTNSQSLLIKLFRPKRWSIFAHGSSPNIKRLFIRQWKFKFNRQSIHLGCLYQLIYKKMSLVPARRLKVYAKILWKVKNRSISTVLKNKNNLKAGRLETSKKICGTCPSSKWIKPFFPKRLALEHLLIPIQRSLLFTKI